MAAAEIPNEMPDAADGMMDQRPGVAKQYSLAQKRPEQPVDVLEIGRARGRRDQPPSEQQSAEIQRRAGYSMDYRHHHIHDRLINLQMR